MPIKIDLHNHTVASGDSTSAPEDAIERAIELGLDGVALTEHNSYIASEPAEKLKEKYRGRIMIFRGAEYSSREGHVLVFGLRDDSVLEGLGRYAPVEEVIRAVESLRGVVIIPHPFREWSSFGGDLGLLKGISAIEAYNGHNSPEENEKALMAALSLNIPTTGGSDSHCREEVGACYTEFFTEVTEENFLQVMRGGNFRGACR